jgi:hypothetical protein
MPRAFPSLSPSLSCIHLLVSLTVLPACLPHSVLACLHLLCWHAFTCLSLVSLTVLQSPPRLPHCLAFTSLSPSLSYLLVSLTLSWHAFTFCVRMHSPACLLSPSLSCIHLLVSLTLSWHAFAFCLDMHSPSVLACIHLLVSCLPHCLGMLCLCAN